LLRHSYQGSLFYQFTERSTRYEGWHLWENNSFLKIIERIGLSGSVVTGLIRSDATDWITYERGGALGIYVDPDTACLTLSRIGNEGVSIDLDIRDQYQLPEWGREFSLEHHEQFCTLRYQDEYTNGPWYICFYGYDRVAPQLQWVAVDYPRDTQRHSYPDQRYVLHFGSLYGDQLGIGCARTTEEALLRAQHGAERTLTYPHLHTSGHSALAGEEHHAALLAQESLRSLAANPSYWAGLPWFHQSWTRDVLLTALGLPPHLQQEVLVWALHLPTSNGEFPTFAGALGGGEGDHRTCADGLTWLTLLIKEYGPHMMSDELRKHIATILAPLCTTLLARRHPTLGLLESDVDQTWMDTIGRTGYRIEIQLGLALACEHLAHFTGDESWERSRLEILSAVRTQLVSNGSLLDGYEDITVRPNVIISYLLQPDLLSVAQWEHVFDEVLKQTWLGWGGLSSISHFDARYQAYSTGETNLSYHNGDSWFFVNNLVAGALYRLNATKYRTEIASILRTSTHEILYHHALGHHGEISSAHTLTSWGCGAQGFSTGAYLWLQKELSTLHNPGAEPVQFWD
jgi:hypothetical protein